MLTFNFFNDPLDISYKTKHFKYDKITNICSDIEFNKHRLCMLHKSRIVLTYLYVLATLPEFIYYVVIPLIFIKPRRYCDEYDIPLILNTMLKYKNFYNKSAQICINYAFAQFIAYGNKVTQLTITAKFRGSIMNISRNNLLLIVPLIKGINILQHSKYNEYDIKEETLNEYFILGNPYTPTRIKPYVYHEYDHYKKNSLVTVAGAFINYFEEKFILYADITRTYDSKKKCTKKQWFENKGKEFCFCGFLDHKFHNACMYSYCEDKQEYCLKNEMCQKGKCVCLPGYSRNPMSSLCERNNKCILEKKSGCEKPGSCVFANNRYVCLCPYPYVRVLNTCLHPLKGLKIGFSILNDFSDNLSHDEENANKKEKFYVKVFGTLSDYITVALSYTYDKDIRQRIYVKPVKKMKSGLKVTAIISQSTNPNEPTAIDILNNFLHQLNDATSELNDGLFAYFARFTIIDYVITFPESTFFSTIDDKLKTILPKFLSCILSTAVMNHMSVVGYINLLFLIILILFIICYLIYSFIKIKILRFRSYIL